MLERFTADVRCTHLNIYPNKNVETTTILFFGYFAVVVNIEYMLILIRLCKMNGALLWATFSRGSSPPTTVLKLIKLQAASLNSPLSPLLIFDAV